mgnify:CR=1 FL=1
MKDVNDERLLDKILFDLDSFEVLNTRSTETVIKELEEFFGRFNSY